MNLGMYTNRNSHKDFVANGIEALTEKPSNVYIAVAFFTEHDVVQKITNRGCKVRLIVRLAYPTQASALEKLLSNPDVEIRYFTDSAFHPKVYIFGNQGALVGSANLTKSAVLSNQEVVVFIGPEDVRLRELSILFAEYWKQAKVLTPQVVSEYRAICAKYAELFREQHKLDQEVLNKFGRVFAGNIIQDKYKQSKENIFIEDFRKTYQECVSAFNTVKEVYINQGKRKVSPDLIPLRLEIDSFISFVRDKYAAGEDWNNSPLLSSEDQKQRILPLILEWLKTPWPHLEQTIVGFKYPQLLKVFSSAENILQADDDALFDALCTSHSFHDRLRFFSGGMPTWKKVFMSVNDPQHIRGVLTYLLFGQEPIEERMVALLYDPAFELKEFGEANVKELVGWCNKDDLPVLNSRTTKVLRWFGSDVSQIG